MARKGWDALSDAYRSRLVRSGVTRSAYESGTPLHGARGHTSSVRESYNDRVRRFARTYNKGRSQSKVQSRLRHMPAQQGTQYMSYVRDMVKLYERGDTVKAKRMWEQRDSKLPDYMYYYHGVFGY